MTTSMRLSHLDSIRSNAIAPPLKTQDIKNKDDMNGRTHNPDVIIQPIIQHNKMADILNANHGVELTSCGSSTLPFDSFTRPSI